MQLYDTLSRSSKQVKPLDGKTLKIYTCGLTVYSQPHIGNWVSYIYWDVLIRVLRANGASVNRVQNITDVGHLTSDADEGDDKMVRAAKAAKKTAWDVAAEIIEIADVEAYDNLGLLRPDSLVRATDFIDEQIEFVKQLEDKGYTYSIGDNGVYFDTSKLSDYGKLARLDVAGLKAGARVDASGKKNITDFALWKFSSKGEVRDMEWDSPWGKGFPGWHLECSVMARELLGDQIDIHTGGIDHVPVHHTNEIAQTEAMTSKQFAQIWVHNNHLKVNGTKMSKSLGNIYTLSDIKDKGYSFDAFKLMILSSSYHTEGNFTWEILNATQNRLDDLGRIADLKWQPVVPAKNINFDKYSKDLLKALSDDIDTPGCLKILSKAMSEAENNLISPHNLDNFQLFLSAVDGLLGLHLGDRPDIDDKIKGLLKNRKTARDNKIWDESDKLREQLKAQGIGTNDTPHGQTWYRL